MEVKTYQDPQVYYEKVEPLLMQKEALNNLPLGIAERLKSQPSEADLLTLEESGEVVYTLLHTMRNQWVLPACTAEQSVFQTAADFLYHNNYPVSGVVGEKQGATKFIHAYTKRSSRNSRVHMNKYVYRLDALQPIALKEGKLRVAVKADTDLIADWLYRFGMETGETSIKEDAEVLAGRMITAGTMHLWMVDGEPVSLVNQSRSTRNGATVNAVYTPDREKGKGYATSAVWSLTKKLLNQGFQFCSLYTDADNPVSNSIYKKIGYFPIGESVVYRFNSES
ncbi:GNAT family N-acetyltransferase [Thalassobacillus devorans]|uniref:GNAT family N-acetyltransferase n=1 Tax=Thalassobacillus devorans TaxID=279813 RepID=UPI00048CDFE3|nr:GNAT family N-acetyltransferase [Thalassobacillus devorans]